MPTIRRAEATHLFIRDSWPEALKEAAYSLRLLNRLAWPNGLTDEEREVLRRIAVGDQAAADMLPGPSRLDAGLAKRALKMSHLAPRKSSAGNAK